MINIANELKDVYPFLLPAIKAHKERIPTSNNLGRPIESLTTIINELQTNDFGDIFREFLKKEPIYGFGDIQVKKMINKITNKGIKCLEL
jgi:hypothetical protein